MSALTPRPLKPHPHLLEINARVFLNRINNLSRKKMTLVSIPESFWQDYADQGFDLVWLMGVWQRSPGARERALASGHLIHACKNLLPDFSSVDIEGSPYAVYDYALDSSLGKKEDLGKLREKMNKAGLRLIVDFVPNHLALDHPWTFKKPECFVKATRDALKQKPELFYRTSQGLALAHGKDPYFPSWNDTVQVNYFSKELRDAFKKVLLEIARSADGVRCDMAMLGLTRIFQQTWGGCLKSQHAPAEEFWKELICEVKRSYPDFIMMAEAYWDLEWELQGLGFDFTYDKRFYDRLLHSDARNVQGHLWADPAYQRKSVRFLENHDEERALQVFGRAKSKAAALAVATVPGLRFYHDGQLDGKIKHHPIQLVREAMESGDPEIRDFYKRLLVWTQHPVFHEGQWSLVRVTSDNDHDISFQNVLAWVWQLEKDKRLVIINYSPDSARARIHVPEHWIYQTNISFQDAEGKALVTQSASEVHNRGYRAVLTAWEYLLFEVR